VLVREIGTDDAHEIDGATESGGDGGVRSGTSEDFAGGFGGGLDVVESD
jgi:hypothetical protein